LTVLGGPGVVTSGSPVVFVDDAAEDVAPADLADAWLFVAEQWVASWRPRCGRASL
jgi:hypothetical protein